MLNFSQAINQIKNKNKNKTVNLITILMHSSNIQKITSHITMLKEMNF